MQSHCSARATVTSIFPRATCSLRGPTSAWKRSALKRDTIRCVDLLCAVALDLALSFACLFFLNFFFDHLVRRNIVGLSTHALFFFVLMRGGSLLSSPNVKRDAWYDGGLRARGSFTPPPSISFRNNFSLPGLGRLNNRDVFSVRDCSFFISKPLQFHKT